MHREAHIGPTIATVRIAYDDTMLLKDEWVEEYVRLYEKEIGEKLSLDEGREILSRLVTLYQALCRPLPRTDPPLDSDSFS